MRLECQSLRFSYGDRPLIQNLSLTVQAGERIWIRGKSGSGKSSLLRIVAGLLPQQSGSIQFDQDRYFNLESNEFRKIKLNRIGYLHQENHLVHHWTVQQNLELFNRRNADIQSLLASLQLNSSILQQIAGSLSGGEAQRVNIARMILLKPDLALLDEPTSHLDDENTKIALQLILRELSTSTIILVSHDSRVENYSFRSVNFSEISK